MDPSSVVSALNTLIESLINCFLDLHYEHSMNMHFHSNADNENHFVTSRNNQISSNVCVQLTAGQSSCELRREETVWNFSSATVYVTCSVSCSGWMMQSSCCLSLSPSPRHRCWLLFDLLVWTWMSPPSHLEAVELLSVRSLTKGCLLMWGCSAEREIIAIVSI